MRNRKVGEVALPKNLTLSINSLIRVFFHHVGGADVGGGCTGGGELMWGAGPKAGASHKDVKHFPQVPTQINKKLPYSLPNKVIKRLNRELRSPLLSWSGFAK